jgi:hypothetical protein
MPAYATVGSQIRHGDTLPPFYKARSTIILEETSREKMAATITDESAFVASKDISIVNNSSSHKNYNNTHSISNNGGRRSNSAASNYGCGGYRGGRGRGINGGRNNRPQYYQYPQQ